MTVSDLSGARTAAWLAAVAYLGPAEAEAECRTAGAGDFIWIDRAGTQCFITRFGRTFFISFRGTEQNCEDILTDVRIRRQALDPLASPTGAVTVHRGFLRAWRSVRPRIRSSLLSLDANSADSLINITGHSLGAALALLAAHDLHVCRYNIDGAWLFGCPRVGNRPFAELCQSATEAGLPIHRYVNCCDIVPRVPPWTCGYRHAGRLVYFDRQGRERINPPLGFRFLDLSLALAGTAVDLLADGIQLTDIIRLARSRTFTDHRIAEYVRLVGNSR